MYSTISQRFIFVLFLIGVFFFCAKGDVFANVSLFAEFEDDMLYSAYEASNYLESPNTLPVQSYGNNRWVRAMLAEELTYEEKLKYLVQGAMAFDRKTDFNVYNYIDWGKQASKNSLIYEYVAFRKPEPIPLLTTDSVQLLNKLAFSIAEYSGVLNPKIDANWKVLELTRNHVLANRPELVVIHWDNLPDPPAMVDTVFLPLVRNIDLNYTNADSYINEDYKIESFKTVVDPWVYKGLSSLHTNETFITQWDQGGENSLSILGSVSFDADYVTKDLKWENFFEVKLGAIYQEDERLHKNTDAFKINSKVGYRAIKNWYYTLSLDINSQLFNGFEEKGDDNDLISTFLSPAKIFLAGGMDYKYKKLFSVFVSPLTYKNTLVLDTARIDESKYGVPAGDRSKKEVGGYIRGSLNWPIRQDMSLTSKVYLFSNYVENPKNVDVDFENVFDYNISHVFSLRLLMHLKYDDDTKLYVGDDDEGAKLYGARLQLKQQMSIGLFYRF